MVPCGPLQKKYFFLLQFFGSEWPLPSSLAKYHTLCCIFWHPSLMKMTTFQPCIAVYLLEVCKNDWKGADFSNPGCGNNYDVMRMWYDQWPDHTIPCKTIQYDTIRCTIYTIMYKSCNTTPFFTCLFDGHIKGFAFSWLAGLTTVVDDRGFVKSIEESGSRSWSLSQCGWARVGESELTTAWNTVLFGNSLLTFEWIGLS